MSEDRWVVFELGPNQELCENYYDVELGNRVSTPVEDVDNLIQLKKTTITFDYFLFKLKDLVLHPLLCQL